MTDAVERALQVVERSTDPGELRRLAANAHRHGEHELHRAAMRRLYAVLPSAQPGTLEYDVWQSIHALEGELSAERGKKVRLGRTRQKISRDGEVGTVAGLISGSATEGFQMLVDRNMLDLTFEAVALKHPQRFSEDVLHKARIRLREHGYPAG